MSGGKVSSGDLSERQFSSGVPLLPFQRLFDVSEAHTITIPPLSPT